MSICQIIIVSIDQGYLESKKSQTKEKPIYFIIAYAIYGGQVIKERNNDRGDCQ